jgi:putative phosphonate catabolism associated alcohol dehydrogenase
MNDKLPNFLQGRAVIFRKPGLPFEYITKQVPELKTGEILVRVLYTTICGSDIHTYMGRRTEPEPVVLGHEIVGDVCQINSAHSGIDSRGERISQGDRIAWSIFSVPPGVEPPRPDMPQKSDRLFKYGHALAQGADVFNGGLADYCILRSDTAIIKIDQSIPVQIAATISCAHSTVAGALRVAGGNMEHKKILVFGAGLLGLSCLAMCKQGGASWIGIVDPDRKRLEWGEKFGAHRSYEFSSDLNDRALPWPKVDVVFDMTGNSLAMQTGLESLGVGGCAIWIGAVFPEKPVAVDAQQLVRKLLSIRGLHNYNYEDFLNATRFMEENHHRFPFRDLVEREYGMEQIDEAFEYASRIKPVRVGIKVSEQNDAL